jgi:hypothetical protein
METDLELQVLKQCPGQSQKQTQLRGSQQHDWNFGSGADFVAQERQGWIITLLYLYSLVFRLKWPIIGRSESWEQCNVRLFSHCHLCTDVANSCFLCGRWKLRSLQCTSVSLPALYMYVCTYIFWCVCVCVYGKLIVYGLGGQRWILCIGVVFSLWGGGSRPK